MSDDSQSSESSGEEGYEESDLKKKVKQLDTENKDLKKRLDRTINMYDSSKKEIGKMTSTVNSMKKKQRKIVDRSKTLEAETSNLKAQLSKEKEAKEKLSREVRKKEEALKNLESHTADLNPDDAVAPFPPNVVIDPPMNQQRKKKVETKTIRIKKRYAPLHGVFLIISMIIKFSFWFISSVFYILYFVQLRSMFDPLNVAGGFGASVVVGYSVIASLGFFNTILGIVISIFIFISWSWIASWCLCCHCCCSSVSVIGLWLCLFVSLILTIIGAISDSDRNLNLIFLVAHLILYFTSLLSIVWIVAILYAFIREQDSCIGFICFGPVKYVFQKLTGLDVDEIQDELSLSSVWERVRNLVSGKGFGRVTKSGKKGRKRKDMGSDDDALELDEDDEVMDFERASDEEEIVF